MAELRTLARPYAKALFELARAEKRLADGSRLLAQLASATTDPQLARAIRDPKVPRAVLAEALGRGLSKEARNFVRLLVDNGRLKLLPEIRDQFERLRAEAERQADVVVLTAAAAGEAQRNALVKAIAKRLGCEVRVEWQTDPTLVAGALIRAGDLVIDGSLSGELERLRTALTA